MRTDTAALQPPGDGPAPARACYGAADDDGVLSLDEFRRLCAQYAPDLNDAEVQAGFKLLDANSDGQVGWGGAGMKFDGNEIGKGSEGNGA